MIHVQDILKFIYWLVYILLWLTCKFFKLLSYQPFIAVLFSAAFIATDISNKLQLEKYLQVIII